VFKFYFLFLDNTEWIEPIPAQLCSHQKSFLSIFSTKNNNKYEVDLNRSYSAIILQMRWNATAAKKLKDDCKITITTKNFQKNSGIYINILKMKLRQYKSSEKCIDTLQIKYNGNIKQAVCGTLSAGKIKSYEDLTGKVKLTLSIDTSVPFERNEDFLELQIVATAFKECNDDFEKESNCKLNHHKCCIAKAFVNDSIVNCPEPSCADESILGCASSSVYATDALDDANESENAIQIFLSGLTSLLVTMIFCGGIVYVIYKVRRCMCPPSPSQLSTTSSSRPHRRRRRNPSNPNISTESQDASPSAPPPDKEDLPPSYSELFGDTAARKQQENSLENP
jgi:hypothetical protein